MIGKWEKVHYGDYPFLAKCSRCGHEIDTHYEGKYPNFCSNCGFPMNEKAARRLKTECESKEKENGQDYKPFEIIANGIPYEERPQVEQKPECEDCDYRKFTKQFIDGVVDVMTKNGISSLEELNRLLKGEKS